MPQASASVRTMCRPRPCGASAPCSCGVGIPGGAVADLDPHAAAVGRHPHRHLELGRRMLHRVGGQLREHEHQRVRLAVAAPAGSWSSRNRRAWPDRRRGRREAARGSGRHRVRRRAIDRPWALPRRSAAACIPVARTSAPAPQPLNKLGHGPGAPIGGPRRPDPGATLPFVEERYESELARSAAVLDGVDRALERLSEGTYGQCETCGAPGPRGRPRARSRPAACASSTSADWPLDRGRCRLSRRSSAPWPRRGGPPRRAS